MTRCVFASVVKPKVGCNSVSSPCVTDSFFQLVVAPIVFPPAVLQLLPRAPLQLVALALQSCTCRPAQRLSRLRRVQEGKEKGAPSSSSRSPETSRPVLPILHCQSLEALKSPPRPGQFSSKPSQHGKLDPRCMPQIGLKQVKTEEGEEGGGVQRHPE